MEWNILITFPEEVPPATPMTKGVDKRGEPSRNSEFPLVITPVSLIVSETPYD